VCVSGRGGSEGYVKTTWKMVSNLINFLKKSSKISDSQSEPKMKSLSTLSSTILYRFETKVLAPVEYCDD